jgi:hypothetical protein
MGDRIFTFLALTLGPIFLFTGLIELFTSVDKVTPLVAIAIGSFILWKWKKETKKNT